jgi:hypothetical protein
MRISTRILLVAASALLGVTAIAAPVAAGGRTIRIDDDGHASARRCAGQAETFTTLKAAVRAASDGDRIVVCPGTYAGAFVVPGGKTDLTIVSARRLEDDTQSPCAIGYGIGAHHLENAGPDPAPIIIERNRVIDMQIGGISLDDRAVAVVRENRIRWIHAGVSGAATDPSGVAFDDTYFGIRVGRSTQAWVRDNVISSETAVEGPTRLQVGITVDATEPTSEYPPASVRLRDNEIARTGIGILIRDGSSDVRARDNATSEGDYGIVLVHATEVIVRDNLSTGHGTGILLDADTSDALVDGNDFLANTIDCQDDSTGDGTAGTDNTWTSNQGATSVPPGLCFPAT